MIPKLKSINVLLHDIKNEANNVCYMILKFRSINVCLIPKLKSINVCYNYDTKIEVNKCLFYMITK